MGKVVNYICDVSGVTGTDENEFIEIKIHSTDQKAPSYYRTYTITKLVHRDVASKLKLLSPTKESEVIPEPTFESKLVTLLRDYIQDVAYESGADAANSAINNR